ncbi:hypothetical protein SY86_11165 [Erwinia tracheiphila]|uniref:DUF4761 family protein n=1 Tax=Erwinia tracheiphila TaxID=65700 RepID=A0A0M2KKE3_9GAMM|nr:hypothetical protein SY86_23645 [Erwinia tracheiphila]KKF37708.1 hypothetical protein SY86_01715 [Erwinia tracheiphila]KKF37792.1 hypothetical protein SY86_08865 [Erwinia tracheiphila]KKF37816.1 hypothetical protein SY86_11165 [Erwinia tracheiphila]
MPGVIQVSRNIYICSGFTIRKSPRNALNNRGAYLITKYAENSNNYYGRDFSLSEARNTVRRIIKHGRLISF